jgi:hypothetical protein
MDDKGSIDARDVWQGQSAAPFRMSPEDLADRIARFDRESRKLYITVALACAILIPGMALWWVRFPDPIARLGTILTVIGAGYIAGQVYVMRRRKSEADTIAAGEKPSVAFYRAALERQRDFHRGKWLWSRLAIFVPGPLIFMVGGGRNVPLILKIAIFVLLGVIAIPLNLGRARDYQRRIDELDRLQQEPE